MCFYIVYILLVYVLSFCSCVFCLMIRRPPRSTRTDTRFPYTTLFRSARIIKAATVLRPVERGEFHPAHLVDQILPGRDVLDAHDAPVGAAVLHRIEEMLSILRRAPFGERGRAVLGPQIRVDQHAALALQSLAAIEHRLRLQPHVAAVEKSTRLNSSH